MDTEAHPEADFAHNWTPDNPGSGGYGSGMFVGSHHFTVNGQNVTHITHHYPRSPPVPSDFRMIPLGDIDLRKEICLNYDTGDADQRPRVRRVYSARVHGRKSNVTVAMYQGSGAEEEWWQDIAKYMMMDNGAPGPPAANVFSSASTVSPKASDAVKQLARRLAGLPFTPVPIPSSSASAALPWSAAVIAAANQTPVEGSPFLAPVTQENAPPALTPASTPVPAPIATNTVTTAAQTASSSLAPSAATPSMPPTTSIPVVTVALPTQADPAPVPAASPTLGVTAAPPVPRAPIVAAAPPVPQVAAAPIAVVMPPHLLSSDLGPSYTELYPPCSGSRFHNGYSTPGEYLVGFSQPTSYVLQAPPQTVTPIATQAVPAAIPLTAPITATVTAGPITAATGTAPIAPAAPALPIVLPAAGAAPIAPAAPALGVVLPTIPAAAAALIAAAPAPAPVIAQGGNLAAAGGLISHATAPMGAAPLADGGITAAGLVPTPLPQGSVALYG
ncbi:hypothetical protein B0H13DRAFT_2312105 [Mycena leptocephala]|nr:hypothetical protein B0H13DRAFT_2312105 [Mycena leptocephala]